MNVKLLAGVSKNSATLLVGCSLLCGCAHRLSDSETAALAADVKPILIVKCGGNSPVSPVDWTQSMRDLSPESVWVRDAGLYIQTDSLFVQEWGVFVPCKPQQFRPTAHTDPSFQELGNGVFSYHIAG